MSGTIRDDFRKKISDLDDEFINTMTAIADRFNNIMAMVENDEDRDSVLSELKDLREEVW